MKYAVFVCIFAIITFLPQPLLSPTIQHEVVVRNVIVPIRVFDGETHVQNLTIDDIEVYEEEKLQKIQALYFVKGNQIERTEGKDFLPYAGRSFYFLFHLTDYHPKITEGFDFFFSNVYKPDDYIAVITPLKYYELSQDAVRSNPKEKVVDFIQGVVRRDTQNASQQYNAILNEQIRIAKSFSRNRSGTWAGQNFIGDLDSKLNGYREGQQKLENMLALEEKYILDFATQLKMQDGQKNVFLFYQKEYRPEPRPQDVTQLILANQERMDIIGLIKDCFQSSKTRTSLNAESLIKAFADSSILFNVIFVGKRPDNTSGIYIRDQYEDVMNVFSDVVEVTGGVIDSSHNPVNAFELASRLSESYYLLYYSPYNYVQDKKFKNIEVKIEGKNYRIFHRLGYIAD